jgi:general secretion pathway protein K
MRFFRLPSTIAGFPVADSGKDPLPQRQRGIALLMAIMIVSIVFTFSADLVISSRVSIENAMRHRDNVKAEYMAKSGLNLALFLLTVDYGVNLAITQGVVPPQAADMIGDLWNKLNGIPIGGGTIEMMAATQDKFDLNAVNDDKILGTLKQFDGQFVVDVVDESSKINLNYCWKGRCLETLAMIEALLSCPAERSFLRTKNLEPREVAYRIKDFIDSDSTVSPESGLNDENDAYQKKDPPYSAKNGQLDSIDELRMIEGWDDELHAIFKEYFTVYPFMRDNDKVRKININTASRELLGCINPKAKSDCGEKFELGLKKARSDGEKLAKDRNALGGVLRDLLCNENDGGSGTNRSEWYDVRSDVYSITARGEVGNQTKTITAVVERTVPDRAKKQDRSYVLLHWKMI